MIAQEPIEPRDASRLLHVDPSAGTITHRRFVEAADLLRPGDLLVLNETRVTARRLFGRKASGAAVEALVMRKVGERTYEGLAKPGRRLPIGARVEFDSGLAATVVWVRDGMRGFEFDVCDSLDERIAESGVVPLPPYIHAELRDEQRYQTVYAKAGGSAASPTAGLHFSETLLATLSAKGVAFAPVTLDVGIDTFKPIASNTLEDHPMHGEVCSVSEETAQAIAACKGRIIAVGTTTVRTLESFACGPREVKPGTMETRLFIRPGFNFQIIDGMFTNFHLPRTTMLVMISALAGAGLIREAYAEAVKSKYRFLSFGDAMLILGGRKEGWNVLS